MHVSSYDTNTGNWSHKEFKTTTPIGPEAALAWLAADNFSRKHKDEPPSGPTNFYSESDKFILWSGGQQWSEVVTVFTEKKLPDEELEAILDKNREIAW